jgi:hypothetical protein
MKYDETFSNEKAFSSSPFTGLTKREHFALEIFRGMTILRGGNEDSSPIELIRSSVVFADLLIKELNKETK